jgi:ADP-L-glycero-D-manno-heptose 6-epimerase
VGDVVRVNLALAEGTRSGIFNVGTGRSRSFNEIAGTIVDRIGAGAIEYVPFPENLAGRYQSFTQADLSGLRDAGYGEKFSSLEDGIAKSVAAWDLEQL